MLHRLARVIDLVALLTWSRLLTQNRIPLFLKML